MSTHPLLAGIDFGTTNIKTIVFDHTGRIAASASAPTPTCFPRPGWAYFEPDEVWQVTVRLLQTIVAQVDRAAIASIAVTSVGESAVPLDAQGRPTYPAIAWY